MKLVARVAAPTDDLAACWPALAAHGLNRDQVLVAVDDDGRIRGGVLLYDGGHGTVYVGELTVLGATQRRRIAKALCQELLAWAIARGKAALAFHCVDPLWTSFMLRAGARIVHTAQFLTLGLPRPMRGER